MAAKEIRKDLASAQRELQEALASGDVEVIRSCLRLANAHVADAMRRLG
jgi:hypothetical protein